MSLYPQMVTARRLRRVALHTIQKQIGNTMHGYSCRTANNLLKLPGRLDGIWPFSHLLDENLSLILTLTHLLPLSTRTDL